MKRFDKMLGHKDFYKIGNVEIELEVGSYCAFTKDTPSNGLHYHNCYEIAYVTSGKGYFVNNDRHTVLSKGSVFIAGPGIVHEIVKDQSEESMDLELVYLLFRVHVIEEVHSDVYSEQLIRALLKAYQVSAQDKGPIDAYLNMIERYEIHNNQDALMILELYRLLFLEMIRILVTVEEDEGEISIDSKSLIDIAMIYIRENISRKISVSEVALASNTSIRNLQYLFRKYMDMTVVNYINERKINLACSYLKMNNSVGSVGRMIGIEDISQFSRLFKMHMGISPRKYQKQYASSGVRFAAMTIDE